MILLKQKVVILLTHFNSKGFYKMSYSKISNYTKALTEQLILSIKEKANSSNQIQTCPKHGNALHNEIVGCLACHDEKYNQNNSLPANTLSIPETYKNCLISTYQAKTESQLKAKELFTSLCKHQDKFDHAMNLKLNLWIAGNCGSGKTHLAISAIKYWFSKGYSVAYNNINDIFGEIKATYKYSDDDYKQKVLNRYIDADILVIDELGITDLSEHDADLFYLLINDRYSRKNRGITIFISNIEFCDWKEMTGERIYSRISQNHLKLEILGEDHRESEIDINSLFPINHLFGEQHDSPTFNQYKGQETTPNPTTKTNIRYLK